MPQVNPVNRIREIAEGQISPTYYTQTGAAYAVWFRSSALASAASAFMGVTTPAAPTEVHLLPPELFGSAGETSLQIWEAPTSVNGTAFTPVNRKRASSSASGCVCVTGATFTIGSAVQVDQLVAGTTPTGYGVRGMEQEIILKPATKYLFKIVNRTASASNVGLWLNWYEKA